MKKKILKTKAPKATGLKQQPKEGSNRSVFFSLRWKLLIGFTLLFSMVFAIAFYWFYVFATRQALTRIQSDLLATLNGGDTLIDGDLLFSLASDGQPNAAGEAWLAFANADENESSDADELREFALANYGTGTLTGFSDDPRYQTLMDRLEEIHALEPRAWPYLYVQASGERRITYIADLWARYDPSKATPFLFTRASRRSYNGLNELTMRLDDEGNFTPYTDEWGSWVSAYQPVTNAMGEARGAIGIDFEASYVNQVQATIRQQVVYAFVITYAALFLMVFLVSRALMRPIQKLTVSAERLGEGDYSEDIRQYNPGLLHDEIARLADVFAIMADKVAQREKNLRRQVEALRIEIDEVKKKKQVSEITDTEFFRSLKTKAQEMRKRLGES